ncbi:hypothetical protein THAOC_36063, partial [Thalassiosira oceanica]
HESDCLRQPAAAVWTRLGRIIDVVQNRLTCYDDRDGNDRLDEDADDHRREAVRARPKACVGADEAEREDRLRVQRRRAEFLELLVHARLISLLVRGFVRQVGKRKNGTSDWQRSQAGATGMVWVLAFILPGPTRERCLGRRRGPSCSAECPLHADGSIGSVRVGLSAPMCSRPSHEQFFMSHVSLLQAADVAENRLSQNRAQTPPRERDRLGGVSARFAI